VSDSNASVKSLQRQVVSKKDAVTQAQADQESAETDLQFTVSELEKLANYRAELHGECDFLLKNYDLRLQARTEEREAISEAKAILSGAQANEA
jgi:peptidoglycan hydrolase CwlO-like protein